MSTPYFSIITPTYNRAERLMKTIQSVREQDFANWEMLIIDDGSTDSTANKVREINDPRLKYFYQDHAERSIARNKGVSLASGKYLCFLDDDDLLLPHFLSSFYECTQKNKKSYDAFLSEEYKQNLKGEKHRIPIPTGFVKNPIRTLWKMQVSLRSMVIKKELLNDLQFDPGCHWGQDFQLAIKLALKHKVFPLKKALMVYVEHPDQGSRQKFNRNIESNSRNSRACINDLIRKHGDILKEHINQKEIEELLNHKSYGFASAAMKQGQLALCLKLLRQLDFRGGFFKVFYYYLSIVFRLPFYAINKII